MPAIIVIADDDPAIRDLLALILGEAGHTVHAARDGHEALALLRRHRPHLLVTDHQMPGLTGSELLAHMAATPADATPTLLISAVRPAPPAPPPPNLFLAKPFDLDDLLAAVALLLTGERTGSRA